MSTTIPAPPKPMTRFEAQRKLGLFAPLDFTLGGLIVFIWITYAFWCAFGSPETGHLIAAALATLALTQVLIIALIYRVLVFIMDLGADINLLPEAAARIVVGYWEGRSK